MKRALWIVLLIVVGLATTGIQLDRQSRVTGGLAPAVPSTFRAFAQERLAAQALSSGDEVRALTEAQKLVLRRPIPAEHIRALALAEALAGNADASLNAIQVAARRGWRDRLAQESMLRLALDAGDDSEAALRLAALMANPRTEDELLDELAPEVLASAQARSTFVTVLAGARKWKSTYVRRAGRSLPDETFAEITLEALEQGAQFQCGDLRLAVRLAGGENSVSRRRILAATPPSCRN